MSKLNSFVNRHLPWFTLLWFAVLLVWFATGPEAGFWYVVILIPFLGFEMVLLWKWLDRWAGVL